MAFDPVESAASVLRGWAHAMLAHRHGGEVYQTSTMGALLDGVYDGDVTIRELLRHGDFGLGTFNGLDGEMLVLDGVCYQLRGDGSARVADPDQHTPFAVVTWFDADRTFEVSSPVDRAELKARIDESLPSTNLIVAVRVTGDFSTIRTRTVTEQHRPYRPFTMSDRSATPDRVNSTDDPLRTGRGRHPSQFRSTPTGAPLTTRLSLLQRRSKGFAMDVAAKLTSKGQLTIPKAVRDALGLEEATRLSSAWKAIELCWRERLTSSPLPKRFGYQRSNATSRGMRCSAARGPLELQTDDDRAY